MEHSHTYCPARSPQIRIPQRACPLRPCAAWCWGEVAGSVPFKISLFISDFAGWEGGGVAKRMACAYSNAANSSDGAPQAHKGCI